MKLSLVALIILLGIMCFSIPVSAAVNYNVSADVLSISNNSIDVQFQWINNTNNMGLCIGYLDNSTEDFSVSAFLIGSRNYINENPLNSFYYGTGVGFGKGETTIKTSDGSICLAVYFGYQKILGEKGLSLDGGISMLNMFDIDVFLGYYLRVGVAF